MRVAKKENDLFLDVEEEPEAHEVFEENIWEKIAFRLVALVIVSIALFTPLIFRFLKKFLT